MPRTLSEFLRSAAKELGAASPSPRLDAEALLMHVGGFRRTELITRGHEPLSADQEQRLNGLLARRKRGEPIAYLMGTREFWSLDLRVTPATLIPRPETELLVEQALARIPEDTEWIIADLGTGSGAVALAIAGERPRSRVIATDGSEAALAVAHDNARHLGLTNVDFRHGDWLGPLGDVKIDLVVSNPPYVRADDPHLDEGDVRFEPRAALVGGPDGLDAIRCIAAQARVRLHPGGWLLLEHGHDQAAAVRALLLDSGYSDIVCYRDLAGLDRVTETRTRN